MLIRMWMKGTIIRCWWEYKSVQPLWKAIWRSLTKLKIELLYNSVISLLGIHPKECTPGYDISTYTPVFIAALFKIAMFWKHLSQSQKIKVRVFSLICGG
jgi:hypothetical protein